jgi:hypothetical protein
MMDVAGALASVVLAGLLLLAVVIWAALYVDVRTERESAPWSPRRRGSPSAEPDSATWPP